MISLNWGGHPANKGGRRIVLSGRKCCSTPAATGPSVDLWTTNCTHLSWFCSSDHAPGLWGRGYSYRGFYRRLVSNWTHRREDKKIKRPLYKGVDVFSIQTEWSLHLMTSLHSTSASSHTLTWWTNCFLESRRTRSQT